MLLNKTETKIVGRKQLSIFKLLYDEKLILADAAF